MKQIISAGVTVCVLLGGATLAHAGTIDLSTSDSGSATADIGGTFYADWVNQQSTGTGVIDSFLRIHTNTDYEQGYNTSLATPMDDVSGHLHAIQLSDLVSVKIGGVDYYEFLLDVNQTGADPLISLNQVQLYQSTTDRTDGTAAAPTNTTTPVVGFGSGATEIFRMSDATYPGSGTGTAITLDFSRNSGSGSGDMMFFVNASLFNPANGSYVILYSQFGTPPGPNNQNDGFEEWALFKGVSGPDCITVSCGGGGENPPGVPEPASLLLLGTGLLGVGVRYRRRK